MTDHDTPTDPNGFDIPVYTDHPPDDAARFAALVAESMDKRFAEQRRDFNESLAQVVIVEAGRWRTVKTLADAFQKHTTDEQKRHSVMLKALAAKSIAPTVALVVSLVAIGMVTLGSQPAQATRLCPPGVGGAP